MHIKLYLYCYIERSIILFLSVNELIPFSSLFNWHHNNITMYLVDSTLSEGNMIQFKTVFYAIDNIYLFSFSQQILLEYQNLLCTTSFQSFFTALDLSLLQTSRRFFTNTNILIFIKQKLCRYLDNFLAKNKLILFLAKNKLIFLDINSRK